MPNLRSLPDELKEEVLQRLALRNQAAWRGANRSVRSLPVTYPGPEDRAAKDRLVAMLRLLQHPAFRGSSRFTFNGPQNTQYFVRPTATGALNISQAVAGVEWATLTTDTAEKAALALLVKGVGRWSGAYSSFLLRRPGHPASGAALLDLFDAAWAALPARQGRATLGLQNWETRRFASPAPGAYVEGQQAVTRAAVIAALQNPDVYEYVGFHVESHFV